MNVLVPVYREPTEVLKEYYDRNKREVKENIHLFKKAWDRMGVEADDTILIIGRGISKDDGNAVEPIVLDEETRKRFVIGFGSTGSGKTYLLGAIFRHDVMLGKPVVFIDPKPSKMLLDLVIYTAFEAGREEDLRVFLYSYPSVSYRFNPLARFFLPEEIVSHATAGILVRDQFFIDVSIELVLMVVLMIYFEELSKGRQPNITFSQLASYIMQREFSSLAERFRKVISEIEKEKPELGQYLKSLESIAELITRSPADYFSKVTTTLRVHLTQLSTGIAGALLCPDHEDNWASEIEAGYTPIVFIQLNAMADPKQTKKISRIIASMMRTLASRLLVTDRELKYPVSFLIDELANVVHLGFEEGVNKSREAGIQYVAFTQTVSKLYAEVGKDIARDILGNFNTVISFGVPDLETAQYVSERFGTEKRFDTMYDVSSEGKTVLRTADVSVVQPSRLMSLEPREFYFKSGSSVYFGRTETVYLPPVKVVKDVRPGIR